MNNQLENYKNTHTHKKNKKLEDWFQKLDKINSTLHFKYNNLENTKNDISKRQFYLSLIESSADEKRFNRIKSEFEKNFLNNNEKYKTISNNSLFTDVNKNKNKNNNLFLHLNIYNYKKDDQNTFISQNEKDSLKVILKRFEKKYNRRESIKNIHYKIYANNGFNLSQTNLKLLSSLNNKRKKLNYFNRNNFFKYNLNDKLHNILNIANDDEEQFKKTRNEIFSSISHNKKNPFLTTFNRYKKEKEFENNIEITEEELSKKLEQKNKQIMNEIKNFENTFKVKKEKNITFNLNDNNEGNEKKLNLMQFDNEEENNEENNENNEENNENNEHKENNGNNEKDIDYINQLEEYKQNIINKNKVKKYKLTEKKRIQMKLKDKIFDENKCYDDKVINKVILKGQKNVFSVSKNKVYNSYLNKIKEINEKKRKEEFLEKENQLKLEQKEKDD